MIFSSTDKYEISNVKRKGKDVRGFVVCGDCLFAAIAESFLDVIVHFVNVFLELFDINY